MSEPEGRARTASTGGAAYDDIRSSLTRLHGQTDDMEKFRKDKNAGLAKTLKTKNVNMQELMQRQIEHAYNELAQKEEDLKLAAEIGQHLLERVETSNQEAQELRAELTVARTQLERLQDERGDWGREKRKLNVDVGDLEDHRKFLEAELRQAQDALKELRDERGATSDQGAELGEALRKLTALEAQHAELAGQYRVQSQALREEKEAHLDDATELEASRGELERLRGIDATAARLQREMEDYREIKRAKQELEWDNSQMNTALRETTLAYDQLRRDFAQVQGMLEEAREELRRAGVDFSFDQSLLSQMTGDSDGDETPQRPTAAGRAVGMHMRSPSLAEELNMDASSDEEDERKGSSVGSLPSVCETTPAGDGAAGAVPEESARSRGLTKDREFVARGPLGTSSGANFDEEEEEETDEDLKMREFFQLTVLAIKINSGDILEHIQSISGRQLYRKAKAQSIPFHSFHNWIKREVTAAYIASRYELENASSSNERSASEESRGDFDRRRLTFGRRRAGTKSAAARVDEGRAVAKAMGGRQYEPRTVQRRVSRTVRQGQ